MLQVGDVEDDLNAGLAVGGLRGDVADVAFGVANHAGNVLQHAEAVIAKDGQLHGIGGRSGLIASPFDVDFSFGLVHQIGHVRAGDGVHRDAFAARDIANDAFTADRIATAGAVNHHVSLTADGDGIVIAEDAAHDAGNGAGM